MRKPPWRAVGSALVHAGAVWGVSTLTLVLLATALPDFRLEDGRDGLTDTGVAAALAAAFFGLLHILVWPLLVRLMLLVPALVPGALVFLCNGLLLWVALTAAAGSRGQADAHTAVVVAAVVSAVSSATSTLLAVRDDGAYRRRLARLAGRRRGAARAAAAPHGTVFLQLDGVGYQVLRDAVSSAPDAPGRCTTASRCCAGSRRSAGPRRTSSCWSARWPAPVRSRSARWGRTPRSRRCRSGPGCSTTTSTSCSRR